jgi:hypothetical protein
METSLFGAKYDCIIKAILERLLNVYCRADPRGGWVDHVDQPIANLMPASTLYHVYFGIMSVTALKSR